MRIFQVSSACERKRRTSTPDGRLRNILTAPGCVDIEAGTDIYDIPPTVYAACDEAGVEVNYGSSNLLQLIDDAVDGAIQQDAVQVPLRIDVTTTVSYTSRAVGRTHRVTGDSVRQQYCLRESKYMAHVPTCR